MKTRDWTSKILDCLFFLLSTKKYKFLKAPLRRCAKNVENNRGVSLKTWQYYALISMRGENLKEKKYGSRIMTICQKICLRAVWRFARVLAWPPWRFSPTGHLLSVSPCISVERRRRNEIKRRNKCGGGKRIFEPENLRRAKNLWDCFFFHCLRKYNCNCIRI